MEHAFPRSRRRGLVPRLPMPYEVRQGGFFRGTSLRPVPPGESKQKEVRYLDIHEDDEIDEEQLATWVRQAAALPGWVP